MSDKPRLVLDASLHAMQPLARWLIAHGVAYPAFAAALKTVFLEAAQQEMARQGQPQTDSALSVLSGVHRRDIRQMLRGPARQPGSNKAISLATQVVALWLSDSRYTDEQGQPLVLPRITTSAQEASFETLVMAVTTDIRARAMLDELLRLGVVAEHGEQISLISEAFAPTQDFQAMAALAQANLYDHGAAAVANMAPDESANFLEQAVFVDEISAASAQLLHEQAARAWKAARSSVLKNAHQYFEKDRKEIPAKQRQHRVRFGVYFYSEDTAPQPAPLSPQLASRKRARRKNASPTDVHTNANVESSKKTGPKPKATRKKSTPTSTSTPASTSATRKTKSAKK
jgi:hypothetical protein